MAVLVLFVIHTSRRSKNNTIYPHYGDTIPNDYEVANGLDPLNAADAAADADGAGFANVEDFRAGTDPQNAEDFPGRKKFPIAITTLLNEE